MSKGFPGSVVLVQEGVGVSHWTPTFDRTIDAHWTDFYIQHTASLNGGSKCLFGHFEEYLSGNIPPANTTCSQEYFPFLYQGNNPASTWDRIVNTIQNQAGEAQRIPRNCTSCFKY
jgi:hypothetical protein